MASLHHTAEDARGLFGSSMKTVRGHPKASAAVALTAVAGMGLAGLMARNGRKRAATSEKAEP